MMQGRTVHVAVKDIEHATLCRALGLDQATYHFDFASSARMTGSLSGSARGTRRIHGFVFYGRMDRPVGKITVIDESDKIRDTDPMSICDFETLR
jgi:hypothetical protein